MVLLSVLLACSNMPQPSEGKCVTCCLALRSSGLVRSKAECTSEEANGAVRTLLDILLQSRFCQASQARCAAAGRARRTARGVCSISLMKRNADGWHCSTPEVVHVHTLERVVLPLPWPSSLHAIFVVSA